MNETMNDERLNDFVDGLLSADEAAEVEKYLLVSDEGRETVTFLRALREQARDLPESIEPGRDLWPEIEARMAPAPLASVDSAFVPPSPQPVVDPAHAPRLALSSADSGSAGPAVVTSLIPRLRASQWGALAAAAMLLMVVTSGITMWLVAPGAVEPRAGNPDAAVGVALDASIPVGREYALEIDALRATLDESRGRLDPNTVSTIETNLRVIDRAIRRAREALDEDPVNAGLARMLDNNYRHKLQLLQRANRLAEMS